MLNENVIPLKKPYMNEPTTPISIEISEKPRRKH